MTIKDTLFTQSHQLYLGTNIEYCTVTPTFVFAKSYFPSKFYNYFYLTAAPRHIDWSALYDLASQINYQAALYVTDEYATEHAKLLQEKGANKLGDGTFMFQKVEGRHQLDVPDSYHLSTEFNKADYSTMLEECFTDFPDSAVYNHRWDAYRQNGQLNRHFETLVARHNKTIVGAASIVVDSQLQLGYLHNGAVSSDHRMKGLHTALTIARLNYAQEHGAKEVFSVVQDGGGSYNSLLKLGFNVRAKYWWLELPKPT